MDQNQLLNSLLQHLLLGNSQGPAQSTPALPAFRSAAAPLIVPSTPVTNFITHTSTYVTTITEEDSTVLPITLRGKVITTTLVEKSTQVVTATEYSTQTIVNSPAIVPTAPAGLAPILQTQAPGLDQQLASLLPGLFGSGGNPLLQQQQEQQVLQQQQVLELQQEILLAKKRQEQQQALQIAREQEALNEQLLAKINLDDFTEEDLANLDIDAVLQAVSAQDLGVIFPQKNLFDDVQPTAVAAPVAVGPSTSLLTIFKSGDRPGEFTSVVSTIVLDGRRIKREAVNPTPVQPIQRTQVPDMNQVELFDLGGARGPVDIDLEDSFIIDSAPPSLVPSIEAPTSSTLQP